MVVGKFKGRSQRVFDIQPWESGPRFAVFFFAKTKTQVFLDRDQNPNRYETKMGLDCFGSPGCAVNTKHNKNGDIVNVTVGLYCISDWICFKIIPDWAESVKNVKCIIWENRFVSNCGSYLQLFMVNVMF